MAETIRREKAKAGVERARSYEETGEIYEICSRDRWGSNNNEPPEELDSATAREHEEPCQATNEGKSDGKSNRRSSGYGSGSNRESDGPWNYPFDSRGKYTIIVIVSYAITSVPGMASLITPLQVLLLLARSFSLLLPFTSLP